MDMETQVHLKTSVILNIPISTYDSDFSFIVNRQEYKTSHSISDLLSPFISKAHQTDPALNTFIISTEHHGDFENILKLTTFQPITFPEEEIPFCAEVIEQLNISSFSILNLVHVETTMLYVIFNNMKNLNTFAEKISKKKLNTFHLIFTRFAKNTKKN